MRTPRWPRPRNSASRSARTRGADKRSRNALSIAAASRSRGTPAAARSRTVRVAEAQRKPATVTTSSGPTLRVVCTTAPAIHRPRRDRVTVNSTVWRDLSRPCRAAAASWLTKAPGPRVSRPPCNLRCQVSPDPATTTTPGLIDSKSPAAIALRWDRALMPSERSCRLVRAPCWPLARVRAGWRFTNRPGRARTVDWEVRLVLVAEIDANRVVWGDQKARAGRRRS